MKLEADAIVVGGGPVGLTLACELRLAGLDVLLLERRAERVSNSRGMGMHGRTLEMLGLRGLAPRFRERALPFSIGHFAVLDTRLDFSVLDPQYGVNLVIPQSVTEELLEARAAELGVRLQRGALARELWQDEDGVSVAGDIGGAAFTARAAWLVGADGGRSLVRQQAGIAFEGHAASVYSMLGDVRLGAPLPGKAHTVVNQAGVLMVVPLGDGAYHRLILIDAQRCREPSQQPATLEELAEGACRVAGYDLQLSDAVWLSRFSDETRLAAQYRKGRVLLAGDAAHIHMPAGGQGMNVGMQDAFNLGWKLASVVKGQADIALLDSYDSERRAVGQQLLANTMAQTALLTAFDTRGLALRQLMNGLLRDPATNRALALEVSGFGIAYPASLSMAPDGWRLLEEWTGARVPDWPLQLESGEQVQLHTRLHGGRWLYLRLRDDGPAGVEVPGSLQTVRAALGQPVPGLDGAAALLVRPDGYAGYALA
jgi:2-polyprenyl-6-methoxyphenol hydroxylase-like FAD-dependent oxidoreductase